MMRYETGVAIGRGASAEVFKAWDPVEGRHVALKLFTAADPGKDGEAARREREVRAQASLEHPSICAIYEVGETSGGQPFIAMQYVDGEPLDEACRRLPVITRARLMLQIAEAVAVAHRAGLVHRDLKPGNVLVEEQADGSVRAFVLDFGLVRFNEATRLTETGQVLGVTVDSYALDTASETNDNKLGFGLFGQTDQTTDATITLRAGDNVITLTVNATTGEVSIGQVN